MIITTDDLCLSYLDNFIYFDKLKKKYRVWKLLPLR